MIDKIKSAVSSRVADNASAIDIHNVRFVAGDEAVHASADEYSLEDVITHILQNAQRYRPAESEITITLAATEAQATMTITSIGPAIDDALIDKIIEYGVSGANAKSGGTTHAGNRGQGLYVAKLTWRRWAERSRRAIRRTGLVLF